VLHPSRGRDRRSRTVSEEREHALLGEDFALSDGGHIVFQNFSDSFLLSRYSEIVIALFPPVRHDYVN